MPEYHELPELLQRFKDGHHGNQSQIARERVEMETSGEGTDKVDDLIRPNTAHQRMEGARATRK